MTLELLRAYAARALVRLAVRVDGRPGVRYSITHQQPRVWCQ